MKTFNEVNFDLKLLDTPDWGIENDDAFRVKEFILYHNNNNINEYVKSGFIDLILSSMNEAILKNKVDKETMFLFSEYLDSIKQTNYNLMLISYWINIESSDKENFPISSLIKNILKIK